MKIHKFTLLFFLASIIPFYKTIGQVDSSDYQMLKSMVADLQNKVDGMKPGVSSFLFTGFTNLTYHQDLDDLEVSRFDHAGFSPIMLWKPSDKLFFEAELHIEIEGGVHGGEIDGGHGHGDEEVEGGHEGSSHFDLGYANMVYQLKPNLMLTAGKFLSPIGIYNERYHPSWINPLPIDPLGMGHGGPIPAAELGVQLRGGLQTGSSKVTYSFYLTNGPILNEGAAAPDDAGKLIFSNFSDNNANKAIGGRFSWLPLSNSSLELGVSGQYAGKVGDRGTAFKDVSASLYGFDYNYIKNISGFGLLKFSGQYITTKVSDVNYRNTLEDILLGAPITYTFNNKSDFYYAIASIRPIGNEKPFIANSELIVRLDSGKTPEGSNWNLDETRVIIGYTYWLAARSALKAAVSFEDTNILYLQWALGF